MDLFSLENVCTARTCDPLYRTIGHHLIIFISRRYDYCCYYYDDDDDSQGSSIYQSGNVWCDEG